MGKQISSLWVGLTGSVSGLAKSFSGAITPIKSLGSAVAGLNSKLVSTGPAAAKFAAASAGLAAGAAAAGLVALTKSSISNIDALGDQAASLGVSTEALSRLQYASSFAGVGSEALGTSMGKMLVNLNAATTGSKPAAAAFQRLGLNAQQLSAMAPEQAFAKIADAIGGIQSPSAKAAAAVEIFGKSGRSLIPVLDMGAAGLRTAYTEADRLGVTVSGFDASNISAAADTMDKLGWAATGAGNSLATKLAPYIEAVGNKLLGVAASGEGVGPKVSVAFEWVTAAVGKSADYLDLLKAGFYTLKGVATIALLGLVAPLDVVIQGLDWLGRKLGIISEPSTWAAFSGAVTKDLFEQADASFKAAGQSFDDFQKGVTGNKARQAFADLNKEIEETQKNRQPKPPAPIEPTGGTGGGFLWESIKGIGGKLGDAFGSATKFLGDAIDKAIPDEREIDIKPRFASIVMAGSAESIGARFRAQAEKAATDRASRAINYGGGAKGGTASNYGKINAPPGRGMNAAGSDIAKQQLAVVKRIEEHLATLARGGGGGGGGGITLEEVNL